MNTKNRYETHRQFRDSQNPIYYDRFLPSWQKINVSSISHHSTGWKLEILKSWLNYAHGMSSYYDVRPDAWKMKAK